MTRYQVRIVVVRCTPYEVEVEGPDPQTACDVASDLFHDGLHEEWATNDWDADSHTIRVEYEATELKEAS